MDAVSIVLSLVLVGLNAFFVATEFAIVKVRPTRIEELSRKGRPGASSVRALLSNIDAYLSATQLGITLASLGLGWVGEPAFAHLIEGPLMALGVTDPLWVHRIALAGAFFIITLLHIVLGELAPKSLSILRAESVALAVAYPMRFFYIVFFPAIWMLNGIALLVLRVLGIRSAGHGGDHHSEEEIKIILSQARSAGLLRPARAELLGKALSLPTKSARQLMVPRNKVVLLDVTQSWEENLERAMSSGHTRFPLCARELDDVLGVIDIRDALYESKHGAKIDLTRLARPASYFPEMMSAERLLAEFRSRKEKMAVVVDEYGGASGIVTAADVVTEVMGGFDQDLTSELVSLPGGVYEVNGVATLEEVSDALRVALRAETMHTVAGFLMERLGRMPRAGDRVLEQGYVFNVVEVNGPRVRRVRIIEDKEARREPPRPMEAESSGIRPIGEHGHARLPSEVSGASRPDDKPPTPPKRTTREVN